MDRIFGTHKVRGGSAAAMNVRSDRRICGVSIGPVEESHLNHGRSASPRAPAGASLSPVKCA